MKFKMPKIKELLPSSLLNRETSILGKQRLYVLVYYAAALLIGLCFSMFGVTGPQKEFNLLVNAGFILAIVLLSVGYLSRMVTLPFTLFGIIIVAQIATTVEMLYCAFTPDQYHLMLIIANMVLLAVNVMISLIAGLEYLPYILGILTMGTYIACTCITGSDELANFLLIFLFTFIIVCVLGNRMVHHVRLMDEEIKQMKKSRQEFYELVGRDKEQVMTFFKLASGRKDLDSTKALMEMMDDQMQQNVIANVKEYLVERETGMLDMEKIFPELSVSEREICLLVLQGKTLREVSAILDKKESNITCTRTHIRRKLNLQPSDSLLEALRERANLNK